MKGFPLSVTDCNSSLYPLWPAWVHIIYTLPVWRPHAQYPLTVPTSVSALETPRQFLKRDFNGASMAQYSLSVGLFFSIF